MKGEPSKPKVAPLKAKRRTSSTVTRISNITVERTLDDPNKLADCFTNFVKPMNGEVPKVIGRQCIPMTDKV